MPYFSSNFITEAITTDAQSVSGMKPTLTSFFSGASEPAAHAVWRTPGATMAINDAPLTILINLLRPGLGCARNAISGAPRRAAARLPATLLPTSIGRFIRIHPALSFNKNALALDLESSARASLPEPTADHGHRSI